MESWTVINSMEKPEHYWKSGLGEERPEVIICEGKPENKWTQEWNKPEYYKYTGEWNKPENHKLSGEWNKPEYYKLSGELNKPEYYKLSGELNKPEYYKLSGELNKPEYYKLSGELNKPEYYKISGELNKPEYYKLSGEWNKPEYYKPTGEWNKPMYHKHGEHKPQNEWTNKHSCYSVEKVCGDWEKICEKIERVGIEEPRLYKEHRGHHYETKPRWSCEQRGCCDEEMIKQIKNLITILVGAEQSYEQLGFLCMDERFTLVNTSEYFRLCGLRMRWLANGLIRRSNRLFNVNEWINNTTFENWFKVPTKDELSTNDYTGIMKTVFKITMESEKRLVDVMEVLVQKMMKADWMNTECRFDGFKWFVNVVMPCQIRFLREVTKHWQSIHMCNNGYIFDKCEMKPLVQKIEEFLYYIVKTNEKVPFAIENRRF